METTANPLQLGEFHHMITQGDWQQLSLLSDHNQLKTLINKRGMFGRTALHLTESTHILRWLLEQGADPAAINDFGDPVLLHHVQQKRDDLVEILLEFGADPRQANAFGNTPLRESMWQKEKALYRLLKQATFK